MPAVLRVPLVVRVYEALGLVGLALFSAHVGFGLGGHGLDDFFNDWVYFGLLWLAVAGCATRAVLVRGERTAWVLLTLGILFTTAGDMAFTFAYGNEPPFPSVADALYLAFYPFSYVALVLLVRARLSTFNRSFWLDGVTATLASGALGAALLVQVVLEHTEGSLSTAAVNLAYPIGDMLLLALVVGVVALAGWRPGRAWAVLGLGLAAGAVADGIYLFQEATSSYVEGTLLDALWPASLLLLAWAAWQPTGCRSDVQLEGRPLFATPAVCGLAGIGIFVVDHYHRLNALAGLLAGLTLLAVLVRTGLTFRENSRILARIRTQAVTDSLTGLGNRRKLVDDLGRALVDGGSSDPRILIIYDLNGFKHYNDTFGHPAGDALLARLGGKLAGVAATFGQSYRLGGDEFCILAPVPRDGAEGLIDGTTEALSETGEGFAVGTSFGAVFLPEEAVDVSEALRIADGRLYAQKHSARRGRGQPHEVLLQALLEREPELHMHLRDVAELSLAIGRRLGLAGPELEELRLAAELHDVGKLAIPDAVLLKPGKLTEEEWEFVRQHTVIGQRILAAAPALHEVGKIVRWSHERWNGTGYVDGLAGEEIPLAARIIAVCDAYRAMTSNRPYRAAMSPPEALAEVRRCAGSQFDPAIAELLCEVLAERTLPDRTISPAA